MSRRSKKNRTRARAESRAGAAPRRTKRYSVEIDRLELAAGHDGFLRGHPEPALIVGLYGISSSACSLLGRMLARFRPKGDYPSTARPVAGANIAAKLYAASETALVLLAIALEEDSGDGVTNVYALLERTGALLFWSDGELTPNPVSIRALGKGSGHAAPGPRLQVLLDGIDVRDVCGDDAWIGAALLVLPADEKKEHRLCFRSVDGRNDWTAIVRCQPG